MAVSNIRKLIGIPFVNCGRDPNIGLDCWGLFILVMKEFGIDVPDYKISCFDTNEISKEVSHALTKQWVRRDIPQAGLAITMAIEPNLPRVVQHFGVCVDSYNMIHTLDKHGSILSRFDTGYFKNQVTGFWEWNGKS